MNNLNEILDYKDVTTDSQFPDEPVSLSEVKDYIRVNGFVDAESESGLEFDFDDALLVRMITAARRKAEKFCGISIVFHSWKVLLTNCAGDLELPYGPVQEFTKLSDKDGTEITSSSYKLRGFDFQFLETPKKELLTAEYDAGYEDVPDEISLAIMQMVFFWYEHRGQEQEINKTIPESAISLLLPYRRGWTWLS